MTDKQMIFRILDITARFMEKLSDDVLKLGGICVRLAKQVDKLQEELHEHTRKNKK